MTGNTEAPPRARLGSWPTPLESAARLGLQLGLGPDDLWIKRDDLTGLGGGGNKVRKLEWTCGAALGAGATTLVTSGAAQSNHARLTAAAAARLGLDAVLVLTGPPDSAAAGNLALDGLFGARVVWVEEATGPDLGATVDEVVRELRDRGATPAVIPFGGSSAAGALGYAECGRELLAQTPDLSTVVVALGSGGTMAGLVRALGADRVLGVDCGALPDPAAAVASLVTDISHGTCPPETLRIRGDQVGEGYPVLSEAVMAAMTRAARTEGLVLDPIYTGRAMAALVAAVHEGVITPGRRTVFVHTGGMPGLFGHPTALARSRDALTEFAVNPPRS